MTPSLRSALKASGCVGIWETDLDTQTVAMTGALPELLGLDEERATGGVPLAAFLAGVHPEDRERVAHLVHAAHSTAGQFEAEFRTCDRHGSAHRVAARGRVEAGVRGRGRRCLGIALDLTGRREADLTARDQRMHAIDRVVDALIAVRPLAVEIGSPVLRTLIDASLFELGRLLTVPTEPGASAH